MGMGVVKLKEIVRRGLTSLTLAKQILSELHLVRFCASMLLTHTHTYFIILTPGISVKGGMLESSSHDRLVYVTTCLIGQQVEVHVLDGSIYNGVFHATNADDFGMLLSMVSFDYL